MDISAPKSEENLRNHRKLTIRHKIIGRKELQYLIKELHGGT
jgi:hypothetical protein